ncbi:hypothetical protein [Bacillus sp. OTU530]|uniref:hypothetical protein n=1 Tax=Bacillus sp. OTU530 TaxID=3043862 RepID=UPI00313CB621
MAYITLDDKSMDLKFGYESYKRLQKEFQTDIGELITRISALDLVATEIFVCCCLTQEAKYKTVTLKDVTGMIANSIDKGELGIFSLRDLINATIEESHFLKRMLEEMQQIMEKAKKTKATNVQKEKSTSTN